MSPSSDKSVENISATLSEIGSDVDRLQAALGSIDDSLTHDGWTVLIRDKDPKFGGGEYFICIALQSIPDRLGIVSTCVMVAQVAGPSGFKTHTHAYLSPTKATVAAADYYREWQSECAEDAQLHKKSMQFGDR